MKLAILLLTICNLNIILAQQKLGAYNVDPSLITVSGISSGGSMATQLHIAYSKTFSGVGIVTGPPYYCPQANGVNAATSTCMTGNSLIYTLSVPNIITTIKSYETKNLIDPTSNLKNDKVYIYHGTSDTTVVESVVKKNEDVYTNFISSTQFKTVYNIASAHGFITNNFGGTCGVASSTNYINNCNYNQAYDILKHLYGFSTPEPSKTAAYKELLIEFDQKEFLPATAISMDTSGYVYVPNTCKAGKRCKLHIALHGCLQGKYKIGNVFADKTGFNQVGDDNDIIILYPQAISTVLTNPNGCWDWWGYVNANYANQSGPQMAAIKKMVDRLISGYTGTGGETGNNNSTATCFGAVRN